MLLPHKPGPPDEPLKNVCVGGYDVAGALMFKGVTYSYFFSIYPKVQSKAIKYSSFIASLDAIQGFFVIRKLGTSVL